MKRHRNDSLSIFNDFLFSSQTLRTLGSAAPASKNKGSAFRAASRVTRAKEPRIMTENGFRIDADDPESPEFPASPEPLGVLEVPESPDDPPRKILRERDPAGETLQEGSLTE